MVHVLQTTFKRSIYFGYLVSRLRRQNRSRVGICSAHYCREREGIVHFDPMLAELISMSTMASAHEKVLSQHKQRRKRRNTQRNYSYRAVVLITSSLASPPAMLALDSQENILHRHAPYRISHPIIECIDLVDGYQQCARGLSCIPAIVRRRRGRRKDHCPHENNNIPFDLWRAVNNCRGGGTEGKYREDRLVDTSHNDMRNATFFRAGDSYDHGDHLVANANSEQHTFQSEGTSHAQVMAVRSANTSFDKSSESMDSSSDGVIDASTKWRQQPKAPTSESIDDENQSSLPSNDHPEQSPLSHIRPKRLIIEFDTQAFGGMEHDNSIRHRIRRRIRTSDNNHGWGRLPQRGPSLSISLDASSFSSPSIAHDNIVQQPIPEEAPGNSNIHRSDGHSLLEHMLIPTAQTTAAIVIQTLTLLPPLLLSRRVLNTTWTAIVDYFTGRIFRTTFTKLERAYLRYYEFPAATRATARLVSQIGILLGLSYVVRLWLILVFRSDQIGPMVLGVTGLDIGMVGTAATREAALGPGWKVGLPCHQRGKGMAWLCGFTWIAAVVGIGHACAMALSVWGGPLRLQAAAQNADKPKHVLRRIIHHPIIWIKEMEEWKHLSSLRIKRGNTGKERDRRRRKGVLFNPDPLLFPSTWLPLRWLQIFALAKAFSTDPLQYRWCSPEDDKVVIPRLMKQYLVQLALGDEWTRVFLGEKRVGLGIMVVLSYFVALVWMVFTTFTLDGGAAAMLIPSVVAAFISGIANVMIFWNRLGTKEQRKALNAMGLA